MEWLWLSMIIQKSNKPEEINIRDLQKIKV